MYRKFRTALLCAWSITFIVCVVSAIIVNHDMSVSADQTPVQTSPAGKVRNLSLQPEAFRLSRRLGNRFIPSRNVTRQENRLGQFYGCPSWVVDTPQLSDLGGWRIPLGYQLVFRNAHEDFDYVVHLRFGA